MKKILSLTLCLMIMLASIPVLAGEFTMEESFTFDIYDDFYVENSDETMLMEVSDDVKAAFEERVIEAWENMDSEVQLYPDITIHRNDISALYASVFYENPKYYYVIRGFSATVNSAGYLGKLTKITYTTTDKAEVEKTWTEIDKATEEILFYITPDMTDFEKIMTVHDYMDLHYEYVVEDTDQTYLIMLDKKGVCTAYAEAFQHMMNVLGIESTLVPSDEMAHIWNMVKVDNRWYHADITWDDPTPDKFGRVCHEFMLLSDRAIQERGHSGYSAPYSAPSTLYNNADWRDEECAIVTLDGVMYRKEGNSIIDENGNIIYTNLDGGDGKWSIGEGYIFKNENNTGLCDINGKLYFNTDKAIYSYNPDDKSVELVLAQEGICGLFADGNIIKYNKYDRETENFVKAGELKVCDSFVKSVTYENGKSVVRICNDNDEPVWIISVGESIKSEKFDGNRVGLVEFENGTEQKIFVWKNNLEPMFEVFKITE